MTTETFFLKDIRKPDYRQSLSPAEQKALDTFIEETASGAADGDMDIDWQDTGRAYYSHLHFLHSIKDEQERELYLKRLREDIKLRLAEDPHNHMVKQVRDHMDEM